MSTGYRLLVFDWDGTLMDSEARIVTCLGLSLADIGAVVPPREGLLEVIGLALPEVARALVPEGDPRDWQAFTDRYRYHFLSDRYAQSTLFEGALETLRTLDDRGYLLGVATSKARRGLEQVLRETACVSLFAVTRCADETASKPNPRMLLELMDVAGVMPGETLMIGDTVHDMRMARNAGVPALAVGYGMHQPQRLLAEGALDCLDRIGDIVDWLENC